MRKKLTYGLIGLLTMALLSLFIFFVVILVGEFVVDEDHLKLNTTSTLVDENGDVVTKLYIENRDPVTIKQIPEHVQHAFVAIEDARFREHMGIDFRAIGRALYRDIISRQKAEGGSTITQQLAKRMFLSSEKTLLRKTKEVLIAINIERRYSKDEILALYLNQIYFGHGAYGIQSAAKFYFDKDAKDLTVEEGAMLAGLPKAPNSYSPIENYEKSKQRRDTVLAVMGKQGYLTTDEVEQLQQKEIEIHQAEVKKENEAYFTYIDMVLAEAKERYRLTNEEILTGGYRIVVPMDRTLQQKSFDKIRDDRFYPEGNEDAEAAIVLIHAKTGGVLAVQGGREYVRLGLNRVNVKRQPGSTFKPLAVYAPAMESGKYQPYSLLADELTTYGDYTPRNSNHEYRGTVTMYEAIKDSINAPAVALLDEIGVNRSLEILERFELPIKDKGLAIALGGLSEGVTPFDLAKAYQVFANEGKKVTPYFINKIYDKAGNLIGEVETKEEEVISKQTAWYMTRMLEAVVTDGTGRNGTVRGALAGKTGTTSYPAVEGATLDAWFAGYSPSVVGAVWFGYDVTSNERYLRGGSSYPTVLFKEIMNELPTYLQDKQFVKADDVIELDRPIELPYIEDVKATIAMGGKGFMSIELKWTASEDERVIYRIYEFDGDEGTFIAEVQGEDQYYMNAFNPLTKKAYEVVPYDPITKREGERSNRAAVEFKFGFH